MKQIKDYFKNWDTARIIRIVLAIILFTAFYFNNELFFLAAGIILTVQAVFNLSCPGGSCSTGNANNSTPLVKTEKFEPKEQK